MNNQTIDNTNITKFALTTSDNPFNPFTQFSEWFDYDMEKGYNSCAYLARIAKLADSLSEGEVDDEIERAIDEIIQYDFMNIYIKARNEGAIKAIPPAQ